MMIEQEKKKNASKDWKRRKGKKIHKSVRSQVKIQVCYNNQDLHNQPKQRVHLSVDCVEKEAESRLSANNARWTDADRVQLLVKNAERWIAENALKIVNNAIEFYVLNADNKHSAQNAKLLTERVAYIHVHAAQKSDVEIA
ncbi:MAG: hypothetical protein EZS28_035050 [Streblomastix strix]|uniref:Uncharacterized protein n=1 Tax=Streblomastix strix TaxID=222440 RepID=A0A5J4UGR7_9EUKA|nr:MAG: hypothetical protein EZS28_035050 [Streblomastix strix]